MKIPPAAAPPIPFFKGGKTQTLAPVTAFFDGGQPRTCLPPLKKGAAA